MLLVGKELVLPGKGEMGLELLVLKSVAEPRLEVSQISDYCRLIMLWRYHEVMENQ